MAQNDETATVSFVVNKRQYVFRSILIKETKLQTFFNVFFQNNFTFIDKLSHAFHFPFH